MRNYNRPGGSPWVWVAILLGLSAVIGIMVAMLSGGGLGSSASPDWTPPTPTSTLERPTSAPMVEASSPPATDASTPTQAPPPETATPVAMATPARATATSTRVAAPLRPAATVLPPQATATPGLVAQVTATVAISPTSAATPDGAAGATSTAAASPTLVASPTPEPTNTSGPAATAAAPLTATPQTPPTPTQPPPTPTPLPPLSAPALVAPAANATGSGEVEFIWTPTGELPPGTGYEVVLWDQGEDPAAARGVAPPTTASSLRANLNVMSQVGLFRGPQFNWTVLIVRTDPYERLTQPAASPSHTLVYQGAPSGGGSDAPPPPKP